jgi:hypothetical protein
MNHVEWRWRWSDLGTSTLLLGKRTPFRRHPRSPLLGAAGAQVIIDAVNLGLELGDCMRQSPLKRVGPTASSLHDFGGVDGLNCVDECLCYHPIAALRLAHVIACDGSAADGNLAVRSGILKHKLLGKLHAVRSTAFPAVLSDKRAKDTRRDVVLNIVSRIVV